MQGLTDNSAATSDAQVVVLGMHRSGTSVLTQLLHAMGLNVGPPEHLSPACVGNPTGYWERLDMSVLDECMLHALDPAHRHWPRYSGWLKAPFVQSLELDAGARAHFDANASVIIRDLDTARPWVVKDPRLCILLPLWRPYLVRPVVVLVWRDPLEVALSLRARDQLPLAFGLMLWEYHVWASLRVSADLPRLMIAHDAIFADPAAVCRDLAAQLEARGVSGLRLPTAAGLAEIVQPGLRHHRVTDAARNATLSVSQHALLAYLMRGDLTAAAEESSADAELVLQDFEQAMQAQSAAPLRAAAHIQSAQVAAWQGLHGRVTALERRIGDLQGAEGLLKTGVTDLLKSQRWKWGDRIGRMAERVLLRTPQPSPATFLRSVLDRPMPPFDDAPFVRSARRPRRVIALLAAYNEARFIGPCLRHLGEQGVLAYVMDHESTDGTMAIVEQFRGRVVIGTETIPRGPTYSLQAFLARKEQLAMELDADWFMHQDPDEIRLPPDGRGTLCAWFGEVERAAFNAVNFMEFTFVPCREVPDHDHADYQQTMRWYYPFAPRTPHQLKAWKRQSGQPDLQSSGGHVVAFPGLSMYPEAFPMKHYLFLSPAHALRKYGGRQYANEPLGKEWHGWRIRFDISNVNLPSAADLRYSAWGRDLDATNPWTMHCLDPGLVPGEPSRPPA